MVISVNHRKGAESLVISLTITNALNLTLPVPIPDEEKKIKLNFYFSHFFVVAPNGLRHHKRSVKIKINLFILISIFEMYLTERVTTKISKTENVKYIYI